jgi:hypothetical protein
LGVRVDCAQCHDHPFADWAQQDFWAFAAFFSDLRENQQQRGVIDALADVFAGADRRVPQMSIQMPGTQTHVAARYLGETAPVDAGAVDASQPRKVLADWITSGSNPYFARATANRVWASFFGRGIVDPVDNMDPTNPASHPDLLDALAAGFVESDFDLRFLARAIAASRTYQLASAVSHPSQLPPEHFARRVPKALSGAQMRASLGQVAGYSNDDEMTLRMSYRQNENGATEIEDLFSLEGRAATDRPMSVLQALALMNGQLVERATTPLASEFVTAIDGYPGASAKDKLETLFLATLSRRPTDLEQARLVAFVEQGGSEGDTQSALCDVLWAVLNSGEFCSNH